MNAENKKYLFNAPQLLQGFSKNKLGGKCNKTEGGGAGTHIIYVQFQQQKKT